MAEEEKKQEEKKSFTIADYLPLFMILAVAFIAGCALQFRMDEFMWKEVIMSFMGFFFIELALLKLFDIPGFVKGFSMYDIITKRWKPYGYFYPFIELCLGLLFFTFWVPVLTKVLTIVIMAISAAGVFQSLSDKRVLMCACMGTTIRLPLSIVSLIENVGMGVLAFIMLF